MDLQRLITHFTYRIEPKREGGFIAHATDPAVPPIEAPTREELQEKIRATIAAGLASEFSGLKLSPENQQLKFDFHIERGPGGGFTIRSADPNAQPIEGTHEEIESHFAEKLIFFVGKHFMPELSQALARQGLGDVKVFVNRKSGLTVKTGVHTASLGMAHDHPPVGSIPPTDANVENKKSGDTASNFVSMGGTISNSPITPERTSNGIIFSFLLALLIVVALYFFLYHR
jgi:hypothetical protein